MAKAQRGESRDYIPTRQSGVADQECDISEGCAFKATSEKRKPFYRDYQGPENKDDDELYPLTY